MAQVAPQCYMWEQPPIGWTHDSRLISMVRANVLDMNGTQGADAVTGVIASRLTAGTLDAEHVVILLQNFGQDAIYQNPVTLEWITNISMSLLRTADEMDINQWGNPADMSTQDKRRQPWMVQGILYLTDWMDDFLTQFQTTYSPSTLTPARFHFDNETTIWNTGCLRDGTVLDRPHPRI